MFQLTEQEKKFLQAMGRRADGQRLASIFERAKEHYSSINNIEQGVDYGAAVEGAKLFNAFADDIIKGIKVQKHNTRPIAIDDYD